MSPINDSFMSGSLDHSVRIWDLRVNACQVGVSFLMIHENINADKQSREAEYLPMSSSSFCSFVSFCQ
jgi:WD40 repeat protein